MSDYSGRRVESVPASEVERKVVDWLLRGRIPLGYLALLIGEQGLGKSQWLTWLAAENSRAGGVTLICSAEDGWDTTIRPRLEAWEANLRLVRFVEVAWTDGSTDGLLLPDDIGELSREIHDTGANLVTIDPVLAHLGHDIDSHRDASTRQALAPLARLAQEHACAMVAAHHLNKSVATDPLTRASASVAFTAQARSVLLWARDPDDPEDERGVRRALAHVKSNISPLAPTQLWQIAPILLPASGRAPEVETSRVELVGESEHSGRDLLTRRDREEKSALDEACEFLLDELATGPVSAKAIITSARTLGISEKTLRRAQKAAGVETRKASFGGGWEWLIPLTDEDGQPAWPPSPSEDVGHLRKNGLTMRGSGAPDTPEIPEDGQQIELGIFGPSRLLIGDPGYLMQVDRAFADGHLTERELREQIHLNAVVSRALEAAA